jgi:hypothetical protein
MITQYPRTMTMTTKKTKLPTFFEIGLKTYKLKPLARDWYSVWQCTDITSLKYLGEWQKEQLIKCSNRGELI